MKKKTLVAASLLLALLMPLAVYAEGEESSGTSDEAAVETYATTDAPTEEPTIATYAADEPTENGDSIISAVSDNKAVVASNNQEYESLDAAMSDAVDGDTIYLGAGVYCGNAANPTATGNGAGKSLTFAGAGTDKTTWQIQAPTAPYGADGWCDYSFKGSDSITFENMTVIGSVYPDKTTKSNNTQGLTYINNITLKNCIFNGRADYWGYNTTTFENVTFNAPGTSASGIAGSDYSLWTWTGTSYTFKNCTFNSNGKIINAYCESSGPITINFQDCTVLNTRSNKQVLNVKDSNTDYIVNISGINTVTNVNPNRTTCSRLFQVESVGDGKQHYATVSIDGTTVWQNGKMVSHAIDTTNDKYTDGYKDNQVYNNYSAWSDWAQDDNDPHIFHHTRTVTEKCHYCNYSKPLDPETETKQEFLLHYDLNGGTGAESVDYSDRYYFEPKDGNTATVTVDPSRAGYVFAGWQDADGNWYAAGNTVTVDRDITLTAQWNKLVTVSFDLCGHGGANIASQTFVSGGKASEPAAPKEDGWVFGGWYTERSCLNRFNFDTAVTSDITLYAKWTRVAAAVTTPTSTPAPTPAPAATAKSVKSSAIPQTSDAFPIEGLLALLAVGAIGTGAAGYLRKKRR